MRVDGCKRETGAVQPAGWLRSALLFGVPALVFFGLFHVAGPRLRATGMSWWVLFHVLLIAPLGLMLVCALIGAAFDGFKQPARLKERLRLHTPSMSGWLWAIALACFMYGGNIADSVAVFGASVALVLERNSNLWMYPAVVAAVMVKRNAVGLATMLQSIVFFTPSEFYVEFFRHFGPTDFMGMPLKGAWWLLVYYACSILLLNIGGEELWWRGYVLPRQELAFGGSTWVLHGVMWSAFHVFMQPTLWDTTRMAITGAALAFVVQRTRNTWTGVIGHAAGNLPFFLNLVRGVNGA